MNEPHCYGNMGWILKYPKDKIPKSSICNCCFVNKCKEITLSKMGKDSAQSSVNNSVVKKCLPEK